MKVSNIYSGKYLVGDDLGSSRAQVEIEKVGEAEVPDFNDKSVMRQRIVLTFKGKGKQMLLGARNARKLADVLGDDCDGWVGKKLEIYAERESIAGTMKNVIKVAVPSQQEPGQQKLNF